MYMAAGAANDDKVVIKVVWLPDNDKLIVFLQALRWCNIASYTSMQYKDHGT